MLSKLSVMICEDAQYLFLTGQTLALHGVLVVDWQLAKEMPATLQRSNRPRHGTLRLRDELHVLHGLMRDQEQFVLGYFCHRLSI